MDHFRDLFTPRQALALATFGRAIQEAGGELRKELGGEFAQAVQCCLALAFGRLSDFCSSLCVLNTTGNRGCKNTFARQALPIVWDFMETAPLNSVGANWLGGLDTLEETIRSQAVLGTQGHTHAASATAHPLPDDTAFAVITDPPYYDAVPYSDLADFFYVWLKRALPPEMGFQEALTPKADECIVDDAKGKDKLFFETTMRCAMAEARRIARPDAIGVVVFAHKSTSGWEALLQAMVEAGWIVTGSWPIDTERPGRLRAMESAALASSVHLVCRPRENPGGSVRDTDVGNWREVLIELPLRIHHWMPRLAAEGVVGADAIFACLGPALEIFSRYSRVERANGEVVSLREYLEQVWAAVSREALLMIFADPETAGLDEDARLTAMWLWTIAAPTSTVAVDAPAEDESQVDEDQDYDHSAAPVPAPGFTLEFDAARKIAQGLGARLEELEDIVLVKGDKARLLSVAERTKYLFGGADAAPTTKKASKKKPQRLLFEELEEVAEQQGWGEVGTPRAGSTTLDRVHQAMILFGAGRGEALKRFLVDEGVGRLAQFWKLAQALSALYPVGTDEKRWVDGVLARKKGLGF